MSKQRVEFYLDSRTLDLLDSIAAERGFELAPPYAVRTGRKWDWRAALEFLVSDYHSSHLSIEDALEQAVSFISEIAGDGVDISLEGRRISVSMGSRSFSREIEA